MSNQNITECCPKFNPEPWDNKILDWDNKKFVKDKVFTLFYMPINFGSVIKKLDAKVREAGAKFEDNMGLSDHTSKWMSSTQLVKQRFSTFLD